MIDDGEQAPTFELPAVVAGEITRIALEEYLGQEIVILAFYPGDFNPACSEESTDLDELDLFTMQKDVAILGISGDSIHSHQAFADAYDLRIPLLSDSRGEVTESYGVAADDDAGYLTRRAVVVVDHRGQVEYSWVAENLEALPDTEAIRDAVEGIGGDETAQARYRVGHARYIEGRRAFTSAMTEFENREWMMAQSDFTRAHDEFAEAAEEFDTAVRFAESETALTYYERAKRKADALWQAAEWLADAASAFASGEGREGQSMRDDAETPLETARDIHEPPDPDDFPPETAPAEQDDRPSILPTDDTVQDVSLDAEFEETADAGAATESETNAGQTTADASASPTTAAANDASTEGEIDEAELEEITAELEEQTEAVEEQPEMETDAPDHTTPSEHDAEDIQDDVTEEDLELDLTDPTDGQRGEADSDGDTEDDEDGNGENGVDNDPDIEELSGDHGVPDSL